MRKLLLGAMTVSVLTSLIYSQTSRSSSPPPGPPSYCKPCLFYAGDFTPKLGGANALFNGYSEVGRGQVFVPFTVPSGHTWTVTGAFVNALTDAASLQPVGTPWSIWTGLSQGQAGTQLGGCSNNATMKATGRKGFGYNEYTFMVMFSSTCVVHLTSGTYWLTLMPQDTVNYSLFFLADVEAKPVAPHQFGPKEPIDQSFATSPTFGTNYVPTWGQFGACGGVGCDKFSVGLIGTSK